MYKMDAILDTFGLNKFDEEILKSFNEITESEDVIKISIKFHNFEYWSFPNRLTINEIVLRMKG